MGRHGPRRAVRDTGFWKEGDTWSVIGHPWSVNLGMRAGGRGSRGAEMEGLGVTVGNRVREVLSEQVTLGQRPE